MADIFTKLRRKNFQTIVNAHVDFGSMTGRNQNSIVKTTAGLMKLIYPHAKPDTITVEELKRCLDLATETRQLILEQLAISASGEFKGINLKESVQIK